MMIFRKKSDWKTNMFTIVCQSPRKNTTHLHVLFFYLKKVNLSNFEDLHFPSWFFQKSQKTKYAWAPSRQHALFKKGRFNNFMSKFFDPYNWVFYQEEMSFSSMISICHFRSYLFSSKWRLHEGRSIGVTDG